MKQNIKKGLLKNIQKDSFSTGTTNTENRTFSTGHIRWNWTPPHFFIDNSLFKLKKLAFSKQPHTSNRSFSTGHVRWNWTPPQFFIDNSLFKLKNLAFSKQPHTSNRSFSTGHVRWNWTPPHFFIDSLSKFKTQYYPFFSRTKHIFNAYSITSISINIFNYHLYLIQMGRNIPTLLDTLKKILKF